MSQHHTARRRVPLAVAALEDRTVPAVAIPLTTSAAYTQNFDGLSTTVPATSSAATTWANDSTIPGWDVYLAELYAPASFYKTRGPALAPDTGSPAGGLYSFVPSSGAADAAFGSIGSNSVSNVQIGANFRNDTGLLVTQLTVSYTGEQWNAQNATPQSLRLFLQTDSGGTAKDDIFGPDAFDFVEVPSLAFTTPVTSGSYLGVNGSLPANQKALTATVPVNIAPGAEFWVKWVDLNDDGTDSAVALDDVNISVTGTSTAAYAPNRPAAPVTGVDGGGNYYSQSFDGLAGSGTNNPFAAYSTLSGFSSQSIKQSIPLSDYAADTGSSNAGRVYSYGSTLSTDRALGSIGSANAISGGFTHQLRLQNGTAATIDAVQFGYDAEQWRYGGTAVAAPGAQKFKFQYSLSDGGFWVDVPQLDATSTVNSGPAGALDGNVNKSSKSAVLDGIGAGLNWQPGQYVLFRWVDLDDSGNDNGLAIDNVTVKPATVGGGAEYAAAGVNDDGVGGFEFTQNFDTGLPTDGSAAFANGQVPGAFGYTSNGGARPDTVTADAGSGNAGGLYSYGAGPGDPAQTDRALGSLGSGNVQVGRVSYGVAVRNTTAGTIDSLDISYVGEQWRRADNTVAQKLDFQYSVDGGLTWVDVNALDFTGPQTGATATALNGNAAGNQAVLSATISGMSVQSGGVVLLRWSDENDAGTDHGLAVDELVLNGTYV